MDKIQLVVLGLTANPSSANAYALILKELDGHRRLPIIIGAFEAQAIALELEGVVPPRPMTHDLLKNVIDELRGTLSEVYINELKDGTFYARVIFEDLGVELDARPSDAVALAVRCNVPIFVNSDILDETAVMPQGDEMEDEEEEDPMLKTPKEAKAKKPKSKLEMLQSQLDKAISDEDYEKAAGIRDELKKILDSQ